MFYCFFILQSQQCNLKDLNLLLTSSQLSLISYHIQGMQTYEYLDVKQYQSGKSTESIILENKIKFIINTSFK